MVLVEELADEPEPQTAKIQEPKGPTKKEATLRQGFLENNKEALYGPEGSPEGHVAPETHKAHAEHKMNEDLNEGMHRGAKENNGLPRPQWYTKEWPKDCQYNSPGCVLDELTTSRHDTDLHRKLVRDNDRWRKAMIPGEKSMSFSFMQMTDEDLAEVVKKLKGNEAVTELDLTHNKIKDAGIQNLVAALAGGSAPNLRDLRLYSNEFGELGKTMLTQGLPVLRKKIDVRWEEPSWTLTGKSKNANSATLPAETSSN